MTSLSLGERLERACCGCIFSAIREECQASLPFAVACRRTRFRLCRAWSLLSSQPPCCCTRCSGAACTTGIVLRIGELPPGGLCNSRRSAATVVTRRLRRPLFGSTSLGTSPPSATDGGMTTSKNATLPIVPSSPAKHRGSICAATCSATGCSPMRRRLPVCWGCVGPRPAIRRDRIRRLPSTARNHGSASG